MDESDDIEIPPGAKMLELDVQHIVETYPDIAHGPEFLLEAMAQEFPDFPRTVHAILALQMMELVAKPFPGREEEMLKAIEWLKAQWARMKIVDKTGRRAGGRQGRERLEERMSPQEIIQDMQRLHAECVRERRIALTIHGAFGAAEAAMAVLCTVWAAESRSPWQWQWFLFGAGLMNAWAFVRTCFTGVEVWQTLMRIERQMKHRIVEALAELRRIKEIGG
jgi:hypothetical protein